MVGQTISHYKIAEKLGEGGMGVVYKAEDISLDRTVALKFLASHLLESEEHKQRLLREARAAASLDHPNICTVHEIGDAEGRTFLAMACLEGQTLKQKIAARPLPLQQALDIALQIGQGLQTAHEKGIVHRDIKPANIMITPQGQVKIMDFGLAQLSDRTKLTASGMKVGTPAYMSPEQTEGKPVDRRSDIWSLGAVLYEMVSGRAPFPGEAEAAVAYAIVHTEPEPLTALRAGLPMELDRIVGKALAKDPSDRFQHVEEMLVDLKKLGSRPTTIPVPPMPSWKTMLTLIAASIVLTAIVVGVTVWNLRAPDPRPASRFAHLLPEGQSFHGAGHPLIAVSSDGSAIVYPANRQLYLRFLNELDAVPIRGTEGLPTTPFISPDGESVGYFDFRDGQLRKIAIAGGTPVVLADAANVFGASWEMDDTIVYASDDGIWRVSANGGTPEPIVGVDPGERVHGPQILPDGESLLFTLAGTLRRTAWNEAQIVVQSLETGDREVILTGGSDARYVPTGHLVYALESTLFAVPFDISSREVQGGPVPLVEGVARAVEYPGSTGTANYEFSTQGTLVYVQAPEREVMQTRLVAVDREGNAEPLIDEIRQYWRPRISPDGTRVAVEVFDGRANQTWIVDISSGVASALTFQGGNVWAAWTPDGQSVIFRSDAGKEFEIYRKAADGSGEAVLLFRSQDELIPTDVSVDGVLVFTAGDRTGKSALWTLRLEDLSASQFLDTPAVENMGMFSPDGNWIAYVSNESGRPEIYVRPYPKTEGGVRRVSDGGGNGPVWARDGSEIYYRGSSGDLMAVPISLNPTFTSGRPRPLFPFEGKFRPSGNASAYDIHPDGSRFIMVTQPEKPFPMRRQINVVLNWFEELKRLVPTE